MDSAILNQLNNIEKEVNSEVTKSERGRKKKTDTKIPLQKQGIPKVYIVYTCFIPLQEKVQIGYT